MNADTLGLMQCPLHGTASAVIWRASGAGRRGDSGRASGAPAASDRLCAAPRRCALASMALLQHRWHTRLAHLVRSVDSGLLVSSPYVTRRGAEMLASNLPSQRADIRLTFLTDLSPLHVCQGVTDPGACQVLVEAVGSAKIVHLPRLHAKAYVADERRAIITSANLTGGGLFTNYEYGCEIDEPSLVRPVRSDMQSYADLGAVLAGGTLEAYCDAASRAQSAFRRRLAAAGRSATRRFQSALRSAEDELLRQRLASGALHTVLAKTILYLLARHGPLATVQMHPVVQSIHPDLCDDTVDRVIDGKRFGKKWKHAVRTAQQQLKQKGLIHLASGRWGLVHRPRSGESRQ